jgi:molybdenum cofactor biosynthesis enzyme MoaA
MRIKHPVRAIANILFQNAPVEAQLIVTRRCNLSCGYCTEYDNVSGMIPVATLRERIDALHRLRVVNISMLGGEPLMHPQLPEVVEYGERHAQVSVTTNGFLLTRELIEGLNDAGLSNMEVSVDAVSADRSGYIQKCLKTIRPKLLLLRELARFDVHVNMVLCEHTRREFTATVRELNDMGLLVSIDLLHTSKGGIAIEGKEYADLWDRYYQEGIPFSFIERDYGRELLNGKQPLWQCRAGSRFLYVDEFGNAQFCSAQRGRLDKPIIEFTQQDLRAHGKTYKGCEAGCSLLCHYRDSALDNRPLHTLKSVAKLFIREYRRQAAPRSAGSRAGAT